MHLGNTHWMRKADVVTQEFLLLMQHLKAKIIDSAEFHNS